MFVNTPAVDVRADVLARYQRIREDYLAGKTVDHIQLMVSYAQARFVLGETASAQLLRSARHLAPASFAAQETLRANRISEVRKIASRA